MADHSHQTSPMLAGQATFAAPPREHDTSASTAYSEKDLDDALGYLSSSRSQSTRIPPWLKRFADTSRGVGRKTGVSSRRSLLGLMVALAVFLTIITSTLGGAPTETLDAVSEPVLKQGSSSEGMLDRVVKAPSRVAGAVKELGWSAWDKAISVTSDKPKVWKGLNITHVLNFNTSQPTMKAQLKPGVRYMTSVAFGGHANQFIGIQKMIYFAQQTNRVAIVPTLIPSHLDGPPIDITEFYDLDRFFDESKIPAIPMSAVKPLDLAEEMPMNEYLACYSVQEATAGHANGETWGFGLHDIQLHFWPLPRHLARAVGGFDIAYDALRMFDFDINAKNAWTMQVRHEMLPQKSTPEPLVGDVARAANVKPGFSPRQAVPPQDQVLCFDNTLFIGPVMFHDTYEGEVPSAPKVAGEGLSWMAVGQYLRFNQHVESIADEYLMKLFDVSTPSKIPPFITIHLRRGDFKDFGGYTPLEKYVEALGRLRVSLQRRLEDPYNWRGPGRANFRTHGLRADQYAVVTTTDAATDEEKDTTFVQQIKELGWKVLDHEKAETKEKLGAWYPTILDAAILARGSSFVGTDRSTFSHLAGLRVKYWNGGLVEIAWH